MTQTSYSATMRKAVAGMVADMGQSDVITGICGTAAGIGFGLAVSRTTGRKDYILGGSLAAFMGVSLLDNTLVHATPDKYAQYENMAIMTKGRVWVSPAVTIARGDPVNFSTTTGQFSNTGGAGPVLGAEWIEGGAANDLALLYLSDYKQ